MEPTITITDEMGAGGIVTVTPEGVQDVLTSWFAEAYADDPQIEACVDTVVAWDEGRTEAAARAELSRRPIARPR